MNRRLTVCVAMAMAMAMAMVVNAIGGWDVELIPAGGGVEARAGWRVSWDMGRDGEIKATSETSDSGAGGGSQESGMLAGAMAHYERNSLVYKILGLAGLVTGIDRWAESKDTLWYDWKWTGLESSKDREQEREQEIRREVERELPAGFQVTDVKGSTVQVEYTYTQTPGSGGPILQLSNIENSNIEITMEPLVEE